jgi:CubicO group peptidase (beta-lactamase class C family)
MKKTLTVVAGFLLSVTFQLLPAQEFVQSEGVTSELHRKHLGEITFMAKPVPIEEYNESHFIQSFELKEKADLNLRIFLSNSLTNSMHELAPSLTAEQLVQQGNWQFSFFVDGNKVYEENLTPGAGSPEVKNTKMVFRVPLISSTNEDHWGRFLWNRFMMSGGQEALSAGTHQLILELRPYVKTEESEITGSIVASGAIEVIVPEVPVSEKQIAVQAIAPKSDWWVAEHPLTGDTLRSLNTKIANGTFQDITSIVVIRKGQLALEEYFNGAKRKTLHDTRSVGKSVAGILTLMAIDRKLLSLEDNLGELYDMGKYAHPSPIKSSITVRQLLTMTSGLAGNDSDPNSPGNEEKMYPTQDWVKFALDLPMDSTKSPGQRWDYFTAGVVVLGDLLEQKVPGGLRKFADENLFHPLGIRKCKWQFTPQGVPNTAGGLRMRSLDLARLGQLFKDEGTIGPLRLVEPSLLAQAMQDQVPLPEDTGHSSYGYLLWNKTYVVEGVEYPVSMANGNGGNKLIIFHDQPWVIVITATAYGKPFAHAQADRIVQEFLIPALTQ